MDLMMPASTGSRSDRRLSAFDGVKARLALFKLALKKQDAD
jgi:hypothetical protein